MLRFGWAAIERPNGKIRTLMSAVDFRWLSEPVVLNDTELAPPDQSRRQPKNSPPTPSAHLPLLAVPFPQNWPKYQFLTLSKGF